MLLDYRVSSLQPERVSSDPPPGYTVRKLFHALDDEVFRVPSAVSTPEEVLWYTAYH